MIFDHCYHYTFQWDFRLNLTSI